MKIALIAKLMNSESIEAVRDKAEDTVLVCLVITPKEVYSIYAISRIGAIAYMIDTCNSISILKNIIVDSETRILVVMVLVANKFESILDETGVERVIAFFLLNALPKQKDVKMSNLVLNAAVIFNSFVNYRLTAGDRILSSAPA